MIRRACLLTAIAIAVIAGAAGPARAEFGFAPGASFQILDAAGKPEGRAGAHPDHVVIQFGFNLLGEGVDGNVKEIITELPPGMVGDPGAVPGCPRDIFDSGFEELECPPDSQVGVALLTVPGLEEEEEGKPREAGIYNIEPAPGQLGELGEAFVAKFPLEMKLGSAGSGVQLEQSQLLQGIPLASVSTELWGVPGDHQELPEPEEGAEPEEVAEREEEEKAIAERKPFLTLPTRCDGTPPAVTLRARSWQEPTVWHSVTVGTGVPLAGCGGLRFEPGLGVSLTNPVQDEPTGLRVNITDPSPEGPDELVASGIEGLTVALPEGVSVSPGGLEGVAVCPAAGFAPGSSEPPDCPAAARIGTAEVRAAALPTPLTGSVFLGEQVSPGAFAVLVSVEGFGTAFKISGELRPEPRTGRLAVAIPQLPQFPFAQISMNFFGGPRALLATPQGCGGTTAAGTFVPLSGSPAVQRSVPLGIAHRDGGDCPAEAAFAPQFSAGTTGLSAGRSTGFVMSLERQPGERSLGGFDLTLPKGLTAALGSVRPCAAADAARGSCPAASRVGSVHATVGSGPATAALTGDAFLTGPYRGAPFGIAIAPRAALGPFDAGTMVARGAVRIDPLSGQVSIAMDPFPSTVDGMSIRLRSLSLALEKKGFIRNPTSCAQTKVGASIQAVGGLRVARESPFAVKGCDSLRFHPKLSLALSNVGAEKAKLVLTLRSPSGSTNLRRLDLPLPGHLKSDIAGVGELCARGAAAALRCPPGAKVGTAVARSPLVGGALKGSVYVAQPHGNGLPDLWTVVEGDGLRLALRAQVVSVGGRLHTRLVGLPDLPLSYFSMRLSGGRNGLLVAPGDLCASGGDSVTAELEGQDHAYRFEQVAVQHPSCGKAKRRRGGT